MGLGSDSEDFAQECLIKAFEVGPINLEFMFKNYRNFLRADKRVLGSPEGKPRGIGRISLDAPVDSSNDDSTKFSDLIGDSRTGLEHVGELESLDELLNRILSKTRTLAAREWAMKVYLAWVEDNV